MSAGAGRQDQGVALMGWRTKANLSLGVLVVAAAACWHFAVVVTATGLAAGDFGTSLQALAGGHPLTIRGVDTASTVATVVVFVVLVVLLVAAYVGSAFGWYGWRRKRRGGKGLAGRREVRASLGADRARDRAKQTRPGLSNRQRAHAGLSEVALPVGVELRSGEPVAVSLEDHLAVQGATGSGKGVFVMIPAALSAPGALVVTSTRTDILDVVATTRERKGRVWVFDPLERAHWPEPMTWDPVAGCQDGDRALSRGIAFAAGLAADDQSSTNAGFFQKNASSAMTRMLHAAALGGCTIEDVVDWAIHLSNGALTPRKLIRDSTDPRAEPLWAGMLESVATGADETVSSSRQTLMQAVEPLAMRRILAWVTPRPGVPGFDADAFVRSTDTLVLLSDSNSSTNVGPLCTMVLQEVIDAMKTYAPTAPGERIDPPIRFVGDEIANVAPVAKLPEIVTDIRAYGGQLVLAFQSPTQADTRWGKERGGTMLEQMAELVLSGVKSPVALERYSSLAGYVEVTEETTSYDPQGSRTSGSHQTRERKVMRPDEIRTMPDAQGLLLFKNSPAVLVRLTPWFEQAGAKNLVIERTLTANRRAARRADKLSAAGMVAREDVS